MTYTQAALLGVAASVLLDLVVLRTRLLARKAFWTAYAIVVFFQLVTNGILTGRHIVTYDPQVILGLRVVWAPVEDLLFGFALVLQTLSWWVFWGRRLAAGSGGAGRRSASTLSAGPPMPGRAREPRRGRAAPRRR